MHRESTQMIVGHIEHAFEDTKLKSRQEQAKVHNRVNEIWEKTAGLDRSMFAIERKQQEMQLNGSTSSGG